MNEKLWVWIGLGAAAVVGALYVSGVIGPQQAPPGPSDAAEVAVAPPPQQTTQPTTGSDTGQAAQTDAPTAVAAPEVQSAAGGDAEAPEATADLAAPSAALEGAASDTAETAGETAEATAAREEGAGPDQTELALRAPEPTTDASTSDAPADGPAAPSFDLVRAEPGGLITVAGKAEPGSEVVLLLDGTEQLTSRAGSDGRFAAFFDMPAGSEAQVLRLRMVANGTAVESQQEVILTPPQRQAAPQVAEGDDAEAGREMASAEPEAAPTVLLSDADGIAVMQSAAPVAPGAVAIDAITYDDTGGVALSGRGRGEAMLQVYLDNSPVTTLKVAADGRWQVALPGVEAGTYTLRVDQVDARGAVTARAESPFRREPAEKLVQASEALDEAEAITAITVQPGNTLWAIARERYGDGLAYVRLFEANKGQIRDPDLIYPGQIFDFPE